VKNVGATLVKYYDFVKQEGGVAAQMRVAMKTLVPSSKAAATPETPDLLKKFQECIKEVVGKYPPR
jgi:hypothetical protein